MDLLSLFLADNQDSHTLNVYEECGKYLRTIDKDLLSDRMQALSKDRQDLLDLTVLIRDSNREEALISYNNLSDAAKGKLLPSVTEYILG
jgi:hypothetical protein